MHPDPIEDEIIAEIEKLPPHEQLAKIDYHWRLARLLAVTYSSTTCFRRDREIDRAELRRRLARQTEEIYRAVEAEIRAGAPRDLAFARVAESRRGRPREAHDAKSIGIVWRQERQRRRKHRVLIRNARIVRAIELNGRGVRDAAWRFKLHRQTVRQIIKNALAAGDGDARAAIEKLKHEAAAVHGPRPGRAPPLARLSRSPLDGVDPREGDWIIVAEVDRWHRLSADAAGLGRRCRSRARVRAEAMLCLRRVIGIASYGTTGIAAKIRAAVELYQTRLLRGMAREVLRDARKDAERLAAYGGEIAAVPDRSLLLEFDQFRRLRRDADQLGRRHHGRPPLKREARLALARSVEAPAKTIAGLAVKLATADEIAGVRQLRQGVPAILRLALGDAQRLAGQAPALPPALAARPAPPDVGVDDCIVTALNEFWTLGLRHAPDLPADDSAPEPAAAGAIRKGDELIGLACDTPSLTIAGVAAKLQGAAALVRYGGEEAATRLMAGAVADAARLAGGLDLVATAWLRQRRTAAG